MAGVPKPKPAPTANKPVVVIVQGKGVKITPKTSGVQVIQQ